LVAEHARMQTAMLIPAACFLIVVVIAFAGKARFE